MSVWLRGWCRIWTGALLVGALCAAVAGAQQAGGTLSSEAEALRQAAVALDAGKLDEADAALRRAIGHNPQSPLVYIGMSEVAEARGDLDAALENAQRAVSLDQDDRSALARLGQLQARMGRSEEALATLQRGQQAHPDETAFYILPALLQRNRGDLDAALATLQAARERGLEGEVLSEHLGLTQLARGDAASALATAKAGLESHPQSARLEAVAGIALARQGGDPEEAETWLRAAIEHGHERPGMVHVELGSLAMAADEPTTALEHFTAAAAAMPESPVPVEGMAAAYDRLGDTEQASAMAKRAAALGSSTATAATAGGGSAAGLAEANRLAQTNRLREALSTLEDLLADDPDNSAAVVLQAQVLFSMGRHREALATLDAAQKRQDLAEYAYAKGLLSLHRGETPAAETALRHALDLDESSGATHALLAGALAKLDRPAEARQHYERALELGVDTAELRLGYAAVLEALGLDEEAERQLEAYRRASRRSGTG